MGCSIKHFIQKISPVNLPVTDWNESCDLSVHLNHCLGTLLVPSLLLWTSPQCKGKQLPAMRSKQVYAEVCEILTSFVQRSCLALCLHEWFYIYVNAQWSTASPKSSILQYVEEHSVSEKSWEQENIKLLY